jgi:hypothetical protein
VRKHALAITAILLSSAAVPGRAEMPDYDVKAYCARIASIGGSPSEMMLQACYQQEQSAYDGLKPRWDSLPASERAYCDRIARVGGNGSFMMLGACIDQERAAASDNQGFQFRR